jgi:cellulose biosynthesis protein BcsQ
MVTRTEKKCILFEQHILERIYMAVEIITIFNNKGGVGKTTLTFHLAHALAELGHKVLAVDLDPQCNLSIYSLPIDTIQKIWDEENEFIEEPGFESARKSMTQAKFKKLCEQPRSIHFSLKPTEEGTGELDFLPPPIELSENLHLVPGRLTLHMFEEALARRWSEAFVGQPLALRTLSEIRRLINQYAEEYGYDYAIVDTSPSLGQLNKNVLTTVDAFLVPCAPDLFSIYGIRNIGNSLNRWTSELRTLYHLIPKSRRPHLPDRIVGFLGYTIYNAKKRARSTPWDMAIAHYNYAKQVPDIVANFMPPSLSTGLTAKNMRDPVGKMAVMHTHNTFPAHAQKYHRPMWLLPESQDLEEEDGPTVVTNRQRYYDTQYAYYAFAEDLISRVKALKPPAYLP